MLFNSLEFLLVFLPLVLLGWLVLERRQAARAGMVFMVLASMFFYAWWEPALLILLLGSIGFNYLAGHWLALGRGGKWGLAAGIIANLSLLAWFKYAGFIGDNWQAFTGRDIDIPDIVLPLAISFFTFQQIAWLVDCARGLVKDRGFMPYCLFVSFFPQLIAGPIVHHEETMPQFGKTRNVVQIWRDIEAGIGLMVIGLFKKVFLADQMAAWADPVFAGAALGTVPTFFEAWIGTICFTFQIYFDFSGYSDIALGLGLLFGIRLPVNFASPYKARNIAEFWRRWHMTLSRFLRDYIYIPLGGNRHGRGRVVLNVSVVMLLGGLWHGAGWNFVIWGGLHGLYLAVYHGLSGRLPWIPGRVGYGLSLAMTMFFVMIAWIFFRAPNFDSALVMVQAVLGQNGFVLPGHYAGLPGLAQMMDMFGGSFSTLPNYAGGWQVLTLVVMTLWVTILPNSQQIMGGKLVALGILADEQPSRFGAKLRSGPPGLVLAAVAGMLLLWSIVQIAQGRGGEFIYFQF